MQLSTMPTAQVTAITTAQQPLLFQLNGFCFAVLPTPTPLPWGRWHSLSHYSPSACPAASRKRKFPPRDRGSFQVLMFNGIPAEQRSKQTAHIGGEGWKQISRSRRFSSTHIHRGQTAAGACMTGRDGIPSQHQWIA